MMVSRTVKPSHVVDPGIKFCPVITFFLALVTLTRGLACMPLALQVYSARGHRQGAPPSLRELVER